ncbi:MAG: transcription elongation factor Spt5 [Nitrososphaeraceae archaeon]
MSDSVEENKDGIVEINDNFDGEDLSEHITTKDMSSTDSVLNVDTTVQTGQHDDAQEEQEQQEQEREMKSTSDSKFFAIRTTGGQEHIVANILRNKINAKNLGIRSILALDNFKGYIIVEAQDSNVAYEALSGIRHARGQIRGELPFKDIEGYLIKKPVVSDLTVDDTVEVIAGPFKAMKAKITRVDYEKQEATVVLLDSPYQIPVTVDANYLKKVTR